MKNDYAMAIERIEKIVAELECEFLYLVNDMVLEDDAQYGQFRPLIGNIRLARRFLGAVAIEARRELATIAAA